MELPNVVFNPEEVALLRRALDEATSAIPQAFRTSEIKTRMASRILSSAAAGERDPAKLATDAIADFRDYISPQKRERHPASLAHDSERRHAI